MRSSRFHRLDNGVVRDTKTDKILSPIPWYMFLLLPLTIPASWLYHPLIWVVFTVAALVVFVTGILGWIVILPISLVLWSVSLACVTFEYAPPSWTLDFPRKFLSTKIGWCSHMVIESLLWVVDLGYHDIEWDNCYYQQE